MNRNVWHGVACFAIMLVSFMVARVASASNAVTSGNWSSPGTWSAGEPSSVPDNPAIVNGGYTVTIDQPGEGTTLTDLGTVAGETGTLEITAGDLTVTGGALPSIRVGQAASSTGVLNMKGGTVAINGGSGGGFAIGDLMVGDVGAGTVSMSSGNFTVSDEIIIANADISTGVVNVSGGTLKTTGRSIIAGFDGNGTLNVSGTGSVTANFDLLVGFVEGSVGKVNLSGGTIEAGLMFSNSFTGGAGSTATLTQTGGTFTARIAYVLGQGVGTSTLTHSGGAINVLTGNGDMVVSDGGGNTSTYNVSGSATVNLLHNFFVGTFQGANGTVNQTGGTITVGDNVFVGRDGDGAWNQSGGAVSARNMFLGDFDSSNGTVKISGGTLSLSGNLSVGAALASNAPPAPVGTQGQAVDANGTFIVSGAGGVIDVRGNLLANDGDHTRALPGTPGDNVSKLVWEVLSGSGVSMIKVGGLADLTGAEIDVDLLGGSFGAGSTFDLITATDISDDYVQIAEDVGQFQLSVVSGGNGEILRATLIPEPASLLLVLGAIAASCVRRPARLAAVR